jgi:hypothetical protein
MNRLKRQVHLFHILSKASPTQRKAILKTTTDEQIKSLCEICQNILAGNLRKVPLKKLKSHKRVIRQLADRKIAIAKKRNLVVNQKGGFLPLILNGVLSLLGELTG